MNKLNPERIDDENPVWTEVDIARAVPLSGLSESLQTKLRGIRGAQIAPTKAQIAIRLDAEVVNALRASGSGWQTRVNDALREAIAKGKL